MVRGLAANWKQPVGFYFSMNAAPASALKCILQEVIAEVTNIGLIPDVVVCDQSACNQQLYGMMGVSVDKPFFEVSHKYFCVL